MKPYFSVGGVALFHGDCRDVREWLAADVLVTDPPYGIAYDSGWQSRSIANDDTTAARDSAIAAWGDRPALVFGQWNAQRPGATREVLTWDKGDWPGMGDLQLPWGRSTEEIYVLGYGFVGKRSGTVLRHDRKSGAIAHPNEKPLALIESLLMKCPPGVVADPFAGSGTTLVAAKNLGRSAIGVELDERYCELAARRLSQGILDLGMTA